MTAYYQTGPPPERLNLFAASNPCPVSDEGRGTATPDANLERWKVVRALVDDLLLSDDSLEEVAARHVGGLDEVEAAIVRRMAATAERLFPDAPLDRIDPDPLPATLVSDDDAVTASVAFQYAFDLPTGREIFRLKTGRSSSSDLEKAIVALSGTVEGVPSDLNVFTGEITELEPPVDPGSLLDEAVERWRSDAVTPEPNPFCVTCRRVATCGQYPSERRVLPSNCLTVAMTKTDLSKIEQCRRRVAWSRFHQIPKTAGSSDSEAISRGILFHDLVTAAVDGDPETVLESVLDRIPPEQRADYEQMFATHLDMLGREALTIRRPSVWAGATFLDGEPHQMRAVTVIGEIDLTADDGNGLALVEIKTGAVSEDRFESDLYAVGVASWFRARGRAHPPLTVHRHFVRDDGGRCESRSYDADEIAAATERLRTAIAPAFDWQPDRPSQVDPSFGEWCGSCEFETICRSSA